MTSKADDICPRPDALPPPVTRPLAPPLFASSVYCCDSPAQAESLLSHQDAGFVYQRDGHPNAEMLAEKCRLLHDAEAAALTASGMAALAAVLLSQLSPGDHVLVSDQLYGRSLDLITKEAARLGIDSSRVDSCDLPSVEREMTPRTRLLVVETISNPLLRVADIAALGEIAHTRGTKLVVDNTFATPVLCRPLNLGADLVIESVSKMMNGHSDVMLGMIAGRHSEWERIGQVLSAWGLASPAFDCWLALRGLATLHLRMQRACENALAAARFLSDHAAVSHVDYPGLPQHKDHALARRQLRGGFGSVVAFHLAGGLAAAEALIRRAATCIPFCPSLGEVCTTLSHPQSTSHRGLSEAQRTALGISPGTIRLSLGVESPEHVVEALEASLETS